MLNPGDRVWVHIASKGYVGVAQVISPAVQASEFKTSFEGTTTLLSDLPVEATSMFEKTEPEYLVAVRWVHTENIDGRGLGNRVLCQPKPGCAAKSFKLAIHG